MVNMKCFENKSPSKDLKTHPLLKNCLFLFKYKILLNFFFLNNKLCLKQNLNDKLRNYKEYAAMTIDLFNRGNILLSSKALFYLPMAFGSLIHSIMD